MANPPPENPKVNDTWTNEAGKLSSWDGENWIVPQENDVSLSDAGELRYWDGKDGWVPYEDPPEWPDGDPDPKWLYRGSDGG
jgi:hypothetical protein